MQIVIDISKETYNEVCWWGLALCPRDKENLIKAIKKGTPLPEGYGRLIILSEDAIKREQTSLNFSCQNWISEAGLSTATVAIIETDKESEE